MARFEHDKKCFTQAAVFKHLLKHSKKDESFEIEKVKTSTLPEVMKTMTKSEKLAYIKKMSDERTRINTEIKTLNAKRITYISSHQSEGNKSSLDFVMLNAIKDQAIEKGFIFDDMPNTAPVEKAYVDFDYFEQVSTEAKAHRATRLINFNTFTKYAKEPKTIILDTRSKRMYDRLHLKGAIHINFSDFTQEYLASMIPDTNTRILIYCNNNFKQTTSVQNLQVLQSSIRRNMASKAYIPNKRFFVNPIKPINTMALNIPTYINLYGYHYRNVFELSDLVSVDNPLLEFEGTEANLK